MPAISHANKAALDTLITNYQLLSKSKPTYKQWFFPRAFQIALDDYIKGDQTTDRAWAVCDAFINKTWFFQRWFFFCLNQFSRTLFIKIANILKRKDLFSGEQKESTVDRLVKHEHLDDALEAFNFIRSKSYKDVDHKSNYLPILSSHKPVSAVFALSQLEHRGLLNGETGKACRELMATTTHEPCNTMAPTLCTLASLGLFTNEISHANAQKLGKHSNPGAIGSALDTLKDKNLLPERLRQVYFDAFADHVNPDAVLAALLRIADLLKHYAIEPACREAVTKHKNPASVVDAIWILRLGGLLGNRETAETNCEAVSRCTVKSDPDSVAKALVRLHQLDLLTGEAALLLREAVIIHTDPGSVVSGLQELSNIGLLTALNREAILQSSTPYIAARGLGILNKAGALRGEGAEDNRQAVVTHERPMFFAEALCELHVDGLLTGSKASLYRKAVAECSVSNWMSRGLCQIQCLYKASFIQQAEADIYFDMVMAHRSPREVAWAFAELIRDTDLLQGDREQARANREAVRAHPRTWDLEWIFKELKKAQLLTGESRQIYFNAFMQHKNIMGLFRAFQYLSSEKTITTQERLELLLHHSPVLLDFDQSDAIWEKIKQLKIPHTDLLAISERHLGNPAKGQVALIEYVQRHTAAIDTKGEDARACSMTGS